MTTLGDLLTLSWLSRVKMALHYRQIGWIAVSMAIPLAVLGFIAVQTVEQDVMRQAQEKVVADLNVASYVLAGKGLRAEIVDGKMVLDRAYVVNGNPEIVDAVTTMVGGTATVFQDDVRITTTVKRDDGSRAVGTRAADNVADTVLRQGRRYMGRAWVVNGWYVTAYDPIRDPAGRVIGMLYVGACTELSENM